MRPSFLMLSLRGVEQVLPTPCMMPYTVTRLSAMAATSGLPHAGARATGLGVAVRVRWQAVQMTEASVCWAAAPRAIVPAHRAGDHGGAKWPVWRARCWRPNAGREA